MAQCNPPGNLRALSARSVASYPDARNCEQTVIGETEMSAPDDDLGFAPEDDAPIPYMQRIRDYYLALGYPTPYR